MPAPPHAESRDGSRFASIAAAITCVAVVGIGLSLTIPLLSIEMAPVSYTHLTLPTKRIV